MLDMAIAGYITEEEQARRLGKAIRTLRHWRKMRVGPPWTSDGKNILYAEDAATRWFKSREREPVRERRK
jgi:hypothetical protein